MPYLRCPSCISAINVKAEDIEFARCRECNVDLYENYYAGWSLEAAKKFIRSENGRLQREYRRQKRLASAQPQPAPTPREPQQIYQDHSKGKIYEAVFDGVGKLVGFALTCFVAVFLAGSNPTKADFSAFFKVEVEKYLTSEANGANNQFMRSILEGSAGYSSEIVDYGLDIKRRDMILFSIYRVRLNDFISQLAGGYNPINECVIGVAGTFLPCPFQEE